MEMKKRALVSVSDKTGVVDFCKGLVANGFEIISTGGTAKALKEAGLNVIGISEITGFPECLDGRVKTLHPNVHAGLLAMRSNPEHMKQLEELNINTIDIVCVNLYPFKATLARGADFAECIENIDIGGPTMIRAAAKNYQDVAVIVDPKDYGKVLEELAAGGVTLETKKYLQYKVFAHTAEYDSLISNYLADQLGIKYPDTITFAYEKAQDMRYGENPQQSAVFYNEPFIRKGSLSSAKQLWGKELSYNNINDANGALELLKEFGTTPAVVACKHANPCGVGTGKDIYEAYMRAYTSDPVSVFGGILAINGTVDERTAEEINKISRNTKGVRIMRMKGEGSVVCVAVAPPEPETEETDQTDSQILGTETDKPDATDLTADEDNVSASDDLAEAGGDMDGDLSYNGGEEENSENSSEE